jgi:hypothetical protein
MAFGVLLLGILYIVLGLFQFLWGLGVTGFGGLSWITGWLFSQNIENFGGAAFWGGIWGMVGGVFQMVIGGGLLGRKKWAYLLAWIGAALAVLGPIISLISGNFWSIFALIIPGIIFWYLSMDKDVKRTFRVGEYAQTSVQPPVGSPRR